MRVIVCGSRGYRRLDRVVAYVDALPLHAIVTVGGARGPDLVAERRAYERGMAVDLHRPDWKRWPRSAGYRRNADMLATNPDKVAAFHDGSSRGTAWMIRESRRRGIDLDLFGPDGEREN